MKIAMWSGPRNLSTAMMYAFAQREDFAVWDEPFYGAYLAATGAMHPLRETILEVWPTDPDEIARACAGPIPGGCAHWYTKHMPHHMEPGFPLDWADDFVHVHLIRHPARVIASYRDRRGTATLEDIGFERQSAIFDRLGGLVIDSADVRADPEGMLRALCGTLELKFDAAMLSWPEGGNDADGPWAPHWYKGVHASTGFAGPEGDLPDLTDEARRLAEVAMPHYEVLRARRLRP